MNQKDEQILSKVFKSGVIQHFTNKFNSQYKSNDSLDSFSYLTSFIELIGNFVYSQSITNYVTILKNIGVFDIIYIIISEYYKENSNEDYEIIRKSIWTLTNAILDCDNLKKDLNEKQIVKMLIGILSKPNLSERVEIEILYFILSYLKDNDYMTYIFLDKLNILNIIIEKLNNPFKKYYCLMIDILISYIKIGEDLCSSNVSSSNQYLIKMIQSDISSLLKLTLSNYSLNISNEDENTINKLIDLLDSGKKQMIKVTNSMDIN